MSAPSVLITGARGGIGQALVERFTRAGWSVVGTDRPEVDVTREETLQALRERIPTPDVIINNAGIGLLGPMAELPDEVLARQLDVNVRGPARVVRTFASDLIARGSGRIINVSSLVGVFTLPWFGAYAASKHALEAVSDALRLELAPFGVHVTVVEPSIVGTGFVDTAVASLERAAPRSRWASWLRATVQRSGDFSLVTVRPEQVAETIFRAATARSPRARYRVGALASWAIRASRWLPTRWADAVLRALTGSAALQARPETIAVATR